MSFGKPSITNFVNWRFLYCGNQLEINFAHKNICITLFAIYVIKMLIYDKENFC